MTLGELVDRVSTITGLEGRPAFDVAYELLDDEGNPRDDASNPDVIAETARKLGHDVPEPERPVQTQEGPAPEVSMDPVEVLAEVYRALPRCLPKQEDHDAVYLPRIGRAPKDSVFYSDEVGAELRDQIDQLPEEIKVLIGDVDVFRGEVTFTLYDEANDVDRRIGPIDIDRYASGEQLHEAIMTLLGRLPRVLAADFN
jgi:hypothetical protein